MTEAGIKVFDDIDSNDQRATARQEIIRMLDACYTENLKEKKSLSRLTSVLDIFIFRDSCIATYRTLQVMTLYGPPTVLLLKLSFVIILLCKFSINKKYYTLFG
jgi:hypothetical protein